MSNYGDALSALADQLAANITNLQAYDYPPDSSFAFPTAIVLPDANYQIAFQGNTFTVGVSIWLLVASGDDAIGFRRLYDHLDPTAANASVKAAIDADNTLGGNVDFCVLESARNVGRQELWGNWYCAAEFVCQICKTVA